MAKSPDDDLLYRVGAAGLASLAGVAIALLIGMISIYADYSDNLSHFIFAGMLAGAVSGAFVPNGALALVEATVHFFIGFLATMYSSWSDEAPDELMRSSAAGHKWLHWMLVFGAVFAALMLIFFGL